ncbi:MAG TPA: hypothetical protein DCQ06_04525, partial [Myxococcales bacterium]|nr:hypothetical protein [Myxococcales bacterium]
NLCTNDACSVVAGQAICDNVALSDVDCTAGQPCADQAICLAGSCTITKAKVCEDNNPCTENGCESNAGGCVATPIDGQCNDGDGCTIKDTCKGAKCVGISQKCDDGNPCTVDLCDPLSAKCSYSNQIEGSVCGQSKVCKSGVCEASP